MEVKKTMLHGHIDFKTSPTKEDIQKLKSVGFKPSEFIVFPHLRPNNPSYEPISPDGACFHFTKETVDPSDLLSSMNIIQSHFSNSETKCYGEAEIVHRLDLSQITDPSVSKIKIKTKPISTFNREFRETELHAYANISSDTYALEQIVDMGLYEAYCKEPDGSIEAVFTIQGLQREINEIQKHLIQLMSNLSLEGRLKNAYIEREDAIGWFLCNLDSSQLPPLVSDIVLTKI